MGDWEERIAGILNDPEQLAQIQEMARSLMGEGAPGAQPEPTSGMAKLSGLLQSGGSAPAQELLRARLAAVEQENRTLDRRLREGFSAEELEQLARERLGLVLPGDRIFRFPARTAEPENEDNGK